MTSRTRVVVIGGGQNCEHDVSLASAASVAEALDRERYDVDRLTVGRDGGWHDGDGRPLPGGLAEAVARIQASDVVFPALHGPRGEDGTLAALCELAGRPYVGSGVRAGALAMDKQATKRIAAGLGIATARGAVVTSSSAPAPPVGLPVVVKPVAAGSSFGVSRADSAAELERALTAALEFDDRALIEEAVVGREVDIAVVQRPDGSLLVGPPLEIVLDGRALFDTGNKYDGSAQFRVPASLAADDLAQLESAALAMFAALGCAGLARFDFFVTAERVVLNEVNTMPGMTEHSQVPRMFAAVGLPYPRLIDTVIQTAIRASLGAAVPA
jgi:D-alanine-D-alanine ligase